LLKSPFVVHPGTGRVCVPVDPAKVDEFDPETVPTVGMLLRELDRIKPEETINKVKKEEMDTEDNKENSQLQQQQKIQAKEVGWEHTSLKPYVEMFEKHINAIMKDNIRAKKGKEPIQILSMVVPHAVYLY
jgi:DNA primase small subunit